MNKKGAEVGTNTIVYVVLGVLVIVVIAIGLIFGWDTFAFWVQKSNVDQVVQGCDLSCNTGAQYAYCSQPRTLVDASKNEYRQVTCYALSNIPETQQYKIVSCNQIDCGTFDISKCNLVPSGKIRTVGC